MAQRNDPSLVEAIRLSAPASVEYRLYHGDERVTLSAIDARLEELSHSTAGPIAYRRVVSAFLREEFRRLSLSGPPPPEP